MMQQADRQRLTHIHEYCVSIEKAIQRFGSDFQSFDSDEDFQHSLSFCLLQIGELGGGLSEEYRHETANRVQWGPMKAMRNMVAHGYGNGSPDYLGNRDNGYSRVKSFLRGTIGALRRVTSSDPNRDPNAETTGQYRADTVDVPPSRKHAKAPESVAAQRFLALVVSSHAGGHWFKSSSLRQIPPHLRWDFSFA